MVDARDGGDRALLRFLAAADRTSHTRYRVVAVPRSYAQLQAAMLRLTGSALAAEGVEVTAIRPDPAHGILTVSVAAPDAVLTPGYAPVATLASRRSDVPPFSGGDFVVDPGTGGNTVCTTGFPMSAAGTGAPEATTAGHCGTGTWYVNDTTLVGTVTERSVGTINDPHHNVDTEVIPTSAVDADVWGDRRPPRSATRSSARRSRPTGHRSPGTARSPARCATCRWSTTTSAFASRRRSAALSRSAAAQCQRVAVMKPSTISPSPPSR